MITALSRADVKALEDALRDSASVLAEALFAKVLIRLRTVRLLAVRVAVLRMSFFDDLLLAILKSLVFLNFQSGVFFLGEPGFFRLHLSFAEKF